VKAEGWYKDPYGLHERRWFSDGHATALVRDGNVESRDEPPPGEPPGPLVEIAEDASQDGDDLRRADDGLRPRPNAIDASGAMGIGFS
jgi:hypothetical protein